MKIPANLEKYVSPHSPQETKLMAAKAMLPMDPKDMVTLLSLLLSDSDKEVNNAAQKSLESLPAYLLLTVLDGDLDAAVIQAVTNIHQKDEAILVMVALNRNTSDETLVFLFNATITNKSQKHNS